MPVTLQPKKIVLIGLGDQMQNETIYALKSSEDIFEVVAICDINENHLSKAHELFPKAEKFKSYKVAINKVKSDIVFISLPHHLHIEVVEYAAKKGLKIIKEKPLALNIDQALLMGQMVSNIGTSITTLAKRTYYHKYNDARSSLIKLGKIYQYIATHYVTGGDLHYGWKSRKEDAGGGALINLGYHLLDILISYFGEVKESHMFSSPNGKEDIDYEVEDAASILNKHESGVYGTFQVNCYTPFKEESLTVFGSKGVMYIKKNTLELFDSYGKLCLSKTYDNEGVIATKEALKDISLDRKTQDFENLNHHTNIMKTISALYQTQTQN